MGNRIRKDPSGEYDYIVDIEPIPVIATNINPITVTSKTAEKIARKRPYFRTGYNPFSPEAMIAKAANPVVGEGLIPIDTGIKAYVANDSAARKEMEKVNKIGIAGQLTGAALLTAPIWAPYLAPAVRIGGNLLSKYLLASTAASAYKNIVNLANMYAKTSYGDTENEAMYKRANLGNMYLPMMNANTDTMSADKAGTLWRKFVTNDVTLNSNIPVEKRIDVIGDRVVGYPAKDIYASPIDSITLYKKKLIDGKWDYDHDIPVIATNWNDTYNTWKSNKTSIPQKIGSTITGTIGEVANFIDLPWTLWSNHNDN